MKHIFFILLLIFTAILCDANPVKHINTKANSIVGVWAVSAEGAPFAPHLFTFHADGTMLSTNPSNVELNPAQPHGGMNDSLGMGVWQAVANDPNSYIGTFCELYAYADTHQPADSLCVSYKIKVNGNTFSGKAIAKQGTASHQATLIGHARITVDTKALAEL